MTAEREEENEQRRSGGPEEGGGSCSGQKVLHGFRSAGFAVTDCKLDDLYLSAAQTIRSNKLTWSCRYTLHLCVSACMYVRVCVRRACICVHVFQTTLHLCVFTDRIFERLRGLRPSQRCVFVLSSQTPTDAFRCVRSRALFLDGFCLVFQSLPPFTRSLVLLQKGGCGLRGGAGGVMANWMM